MDGDNGEGLLHDVMDGEEEEEAGLEEVGEPEVAMSQAGETGEGAGVGLHAEDLGDADDTLEENGNEHGQDTCTKKKEAEDLRWGKRALNWTLEEENDDLRKENIELFDENQDLRQENCRLRARIHHFERKEVRQYDARISKV